MITQYIKGLFDHNQPGGKPYSTSTIGLKIRSLKRFFEYLEAKNLIFIDPTENIKEPKLEKRYIKTTLTPEEADKIIEQPNLSTNTGIRDRSILEVFYSTGIRREELRNLKIFDADLTEKTIRINQGKGGKDRVVPLGTHAVKSLNEYISKVRPQLRQANRLNESLFINRFGNPLSLEMIGIIVKTYSRAAGITKRVTPHTFRHTFATNMIKNNADIRAVQTMLGHISLKTTQYYTRIIQSDVKKAHQETHPRELDIFPDDIKPTLKRRTAKHDKA